MVRRTKYGNVKTHGFDSRAEYARWQELQLLEKAGKIADIRRQEPIWIIVNGVKICKYVADFAYFDDQDDYIVEDVKGVKTAIYRLKKKLVEAVHGIKIREVSAKDLRVRRKP